MTDRRYFFAFPWLVALHACGLPLDVRRIDQPHKVEPRGVRYVLKKPVFQPALWTNGIEVNPNKFTYEFRLAQRMVADDHVYEARVDASLFANTDVTMTLSGDGSLTGLVAGETDQLGPTLIAVATLVTGVAAFGGGPAVLAQDANLQALKTYTDAQKDRTERITGIETAIRRLHQDLARGATTPDAAAAIVALQGELERERRLLQETVFTTNAHQWCRILVANKLVFPATPPATPPAIPWIEVSLNATP